MARVSVWLGIVLVEAAQELVLSARPGNHRLGRTADEVVVQMTDARRRRRITSGVGRWTRWRPEMETLVEKRVEWSQI